MTFSILLIWGILMISFLIVPLLKYNDKYAILIKSVGISAIVFLAVFLVSSITGIM